MFFGPLVMQFLYFFSSLINLIYFFLKLTFKSGKFNHFTFIAYFILLCSFYLCTIVYNKPVVSINLKPAYFEDELQSK